MPSFGDMKSKMNSYSESYRAKRSDGKSALSRFSHNNDDEPKRVEPRPLNQLSDPHRWAAPPKRGDPASAPPRTPAAAPAATPGPAATPIAGQAPQVYHQPPPDQTYGYAQPPAHGYAPPAQGYTPPAQVYAPPAQVYAQPPTQGYAPPAEGYSQPPAPGYAPAQDYAQPPPAQPPQGYAPPAQGYAAPQGYAQPPTQGYPPPQGYAPPAQPAQSYAQPPPVQPIAPAPSAHPAYAQAAPSPVQPVAQNPPGYTPAVAQAAAPPPAVPSPAESPAAPPTLPKRQLPDPRSFPPPPVIGNANPTRQDYVREKEVLARASPISERTPPPPARPSRPTDTSSPPPPPTRPSERERTPPRAQPQLEPAESSPALPSRPVHTESEQITEKLSETSLGDNDLASQIANRRAQLRSASSKAPPPRRDSADVEAPRVIRKPPPPKPSTLNKPKPPKPTKPANLRSTSVSQSDLTRERTASPAPPPVNPRPAPTGENRPPPPPPARSTPDLAPKLSAPPSVSRQDPRDDLELHTQWYAGPVDRLQLPPALCNRNSRFSTSWRGDRAQLIIRSREPDLSVLELTFDYSKRDPSDVVVDRRRGPKPATPTFDELYESYEKFGERTARWSEDQCGHKVGDGECWTLAAEAVKQAGALPAQNYVFGAVMLSQVDNQVVASSGPMLRGDIAQFSAAKFSSGNRRSETGEHHTAVITDVDNSVIHVVEQNVQGSPVQVGSYDLATMTSGRIDIYRPMSEAWVEPL